MDIADRAQQQIDAHENAAIRAIKARQKLMNNTTGLCEECGEGIHPERAAALPGTPYCIDCAQHLEMSNG